MRKLFGWIAKKLIGAAGGAPNVDPNIGDARKEYTPDREGRETSEWKLTLATHAVGVLLFLVGLFWPESLPALPIEDVRGLLLGLAALLWGGGTIAYTNSRGKAKSAAMEARSLMLAAQIQADADNGPKNRKQRRARNV